MARLHPHDAPARCFAWSRPDQAGADHQHTPAFSAVGVEELHELVDVGAGAEGVRELVDEGAFGAATKPDSPGGAERRSDLFQVPAVPSVQQFARGRLLPPVASIAAVAPSMTVPAAF